ncbi:MAG TPA: FAD-dependent thymidylate synthase [Anaerolineae bacterium]|nr:FAD-dependent thymidylate synthase [Anaerolineae bacterium]
MHVELIAMTRYLGDGGLPENLLEHAGRTCYRSEATGQPGRYLKARIREGHESLIEHATITFEISGVSRACTHQLVRHRIASYSQESQRYVDLAEPDFVVPPSVAANPEAMEVWTEHTEQVALAYRKLREKGIRKEDARFLLPNATATRIVVTMNLRSLRHFFAVRCDKAAQWEIRELAVEMLRQSHAVAPAVFADLYERYCEPGPGLV